MILRGRRIHIAGSADEDSDEKKLSYVHSLLSSLTESLASEGAIFVIPFGKEPLLRDHTKGPSIIFDWTIAEVIHRMLKNGSISPNGPNGRLVSTISTKNMDKNIPEARRKSYDDLRQQEALCMEFLEPGWSAGAIHRQRLAQLGDILIGISGGQGLEHLAIEYSSKGKPVIPLDINIGSSSRDGSGGASRLFNRALSEPSKFFKVSPEFSPAELLDRTRTHDSEPDINKIVKEIMNLLHALTPPEIFYVRLFDKDISEYSSVEKFFRETVDPFVIGLGYKPLQIGIGKNEFAWLNKAVFDSLHHSAVALVDLTAMRPNCFMELGYALGNRQRVIVTARDDTKLPFDAFAIEAFLWKESEDLAEQHARLRAHWERNINMPTLVRPREAK